MNNLQIHEIELSDYRQYRGTHTLDLEVRDGAHINVIEGENGSGKSTLCNAITLCLYGEEAFDVGEDEEDGPVYASLDALNDLDVGEDLTGYVRLTVGEDDPLYQFTREFTTVKVGENSYNSVTSELDCLRRIGHDWQIEDQPTTVVNDILPPGVRDYFLLDGERINDFFDGSYAADVRSGILDVSHTQLLMNASDHLETMERRIEDTVDDPGRELERLRSERDDAEEALEDARSRRAEIKSEIRGVKSEIETIEERLGDATDPEVRRLHERRTELEAELDATRSQRDQLEAEAKDEMVEAGSIMYAADAIETAEGQIEELIDAGYLTDDIQDTLITNLIERGECLCGADLSADEDRVAHLERHRSETPNMHAEHMAGSAKLPALLERGRESATTVKRLRREMSELDEELTRQQNELEEISEKLSQSADIPENIEQLETEREEWQSELERLRQDLGRVEKEINDKEERLEEKQAAFDEALERQDRFDSVRHKLEFVREARAELDRIKGDILDEIHAELEGFMNEFFNDLFIKDEEWRIELQEDYTIRILDAEGDDRMGMLSGGEKAVLALSFLSALSRVSGFHAPIVIDRPLSDMSAEPKEQFAMNLPEFITDTQITLFMFDDEYDEEFRVRIEDSVANEYRLDYDGGRTEVVSDD
jgi:DNA sulfur modification protein DndD